MKGLGGKRVSAHGSESVTLIDHHGNKHTLKNVLYVPESSVSILFLMLLKRSGFDFHFLNDQDEGDFLLSSSHSGFEIVGHAIDNILYINEHPKSSEVLAVTT